MTTPTEQTTLPHRSLILVTGATGYIAAHVVKQFLTRGYKVRGTVRSLNKAKWLTDDLFAKETSNGDFALAEVPDMAIDGAYDEAMRGVDAVVHIATIGTLSPDPNAVIPQTITGVVNALEAAYKEKSVKRFVYTSSVAAQILPLPETPWHVSEDTWNDAMVPLAWAPPPYDASKGMITYAASKVEAERAMWKFVEEKKPQFVVNAVHPVTAFGPLLHEQQNASTAGMIFTLFDGQVSMIHKMMNSLLFVDVRDVASVHLAAVLDPTVSNARLPTSTTACTWNDVLAIFRKMDPEKKFVDDLDGMANYIGTIDEHRGRELVKRWSGRDGWIGLEQAIKDTVQGKQPVTLGVFK